MDFLKRVAGIPKTVFCRYNPGGTFDLGNGIMDNPGDAKYGMTENQMAEAYTRLMAMGAEDVRHPRVPGQQHRYRRLLSRSWRAFCLNWLSACTSAPGRTSATSICPAAWALPTVPDQRDNDIMAIGEGVRKEFEEILVPAGMGDVAIFTELGRFMLAPYGCLVTRGHP